VSEWPSHATAAELSIALSELLASVVDIDVPRLSGGGAQLRDGPAGPFIASVAAARVGSPLEYEPNTQIATFVPGPPPSGQSRSATCLPRGPVDYSNQAHLTQASAPRVASDNPETVAQPSQALRL
jgi:hypothetical protein